MTDELRMVLGMGSGRCGTQSLATILSRQPAAYVTHEIRPVLPWKELESKARIAERITAMRYQGLQYALVGDVAHYYLNYVAHAIAIEPKLRVVCLRRDRHEVVESYYNWIRASDGPRANHWARPGGRWHETKIFSKCFPKYETDDMREAIGLYWNEYYEIAGRLAERFASNVAIFEMHEALSTEAGQRAVLDFVGVPTGQQTLSLDVHLHRAKPG